MEQRADFVSPTSESAYLHGTTSEPLLVCSARSVPLLCCLAILCICSYAFSAAMEPGATTLRTSSLAMFHFESDVKPENAAVTAAANVSSQTRTEDAVPSGNATAITCELCQLQLASRETALARQGRNAIVIETTREYGRTGNFVIIASHAITVARICRYMLALPEMDADGAFDLQSQYAVYDFRNQTAEGKGNKSEHMRFGDAPVNTATHCRAIMAARNMEQARLIYKTTVDTQERDVDHCVRRYLGLCQHSYCGSLPQELGNTLVMHIRQGDVFPAGFNTTVPHHYWQPPLDYYLAVMSFRLWDAIIVLSEPTTSQFSPILLMLQSLSRRRLLPAPVQFMQDVSERKWSDDVRTMVCAPHIVLSMSTLKAVVRLGWAQHVFAVECGGDYVNAPVVYGVETRGEDGSVYAPTHRHTNSPEEWVQMLLHKLPLDVIQPCEV